MLSETTTQAIGVLAFVLNVWGNLELTKQTNRGHIIRSALTDVQYCDCGVRVSTHASDCDTGKLIIVPRKQETS